MAHTIRSLLPARAAYPRPLLALTLVLAAIAQPVRGNDAPADGLFVTVGNPITSDVVNRVQDATRRALERLPAAEAGPAPAEPVLKIVYDFNPDGRPASTRDFGPCHDLARFLLDLPARVQTVAFVRGETTRHTVLPVLACRDLVMASDARLGDVARDADPAKLRTDEVIVAAYRQVARPPRAPAVVLKLLDPDLEVLRARRVGTPGEWYIDARDEQAEAKAGVAVVDRRPVIGKGAGTTLFTADQADRFGLATLRRDSRQEVAEAYGLPPASLREDPLAGREPRAARIKVSGPVTEVLAESVRRQVGRAAAEGANVIFLELDCGGGDTVAARDLAEWLRTRRDDAGKAGLLTVAYVPETAPDTATFLAFGCSEIVLRKGASLGDFSALLKGADPQRTRVRRESLEGLAAAQGYPVLVARAMLDPEVSLYRARRRPTGAWGFVTGEQLQADKAGPAPAWFEERPVKEGGPQGRPLVLAADDARAWGVARHLVDGPNDLYALYGVKPGAVVQGEPDFLDQLASFLRQPVTRMILVMVGLICLMLELKSPGISLPGLVAAVCFLLFFWSHWQEAGVDLLALFLFLLGLVLILLEVFVFPGLTVAGLGGVLLVVLSLALVALQKRPQTSEEWSILLKLMLQFGFGLIGAVILALLVASHLPNIPVLNRLVLRPEGESAADAEGDGPPEGGRGDSVRPEMAALLGAIGVAVTPLRPAGKAKFGDEFLDVVSEGTYVNDGSRVQVVEIEGPRIVVKEVL